MHDDQLDHLTGIVARHMRGAFTMEQCRTIATEVRDAIINTPETADFMAGVPLEAQHQRERWGAAHDAGKAPEDWFWLLGYLGGKALAAVKAGDVEKAKHHTISSAAALANWHAALTGASVAMRPGIEPPPLPQSMGGIARAASLSADRRSEIARNAARARWIKEDS